MTVSPDRALTTCAEATTYDEVHQLAPDSTVTGLAGFGAAFSNDGRYLVTSHAAGVQLSDTTTGEPIGHQIVPPVTDSLTTAPGAVVSAATLDQASILVWRFDVDSWVGLACRMAGRT